MRIENALSGTRNSEAHNRFTINELLLYAHEHVYKSRSLCVSRRTVILLFLFVGESIHTAILEEHG